MNLRYLLTFIFLCSLSLTSWGNQKINFCSISINSTNEINQFKAKLPSSEFNFIEVTNPDYDYHTDWTTSACEKLESSNRGCDILLISGHFAGEVFFGVGRNSDKRVFTKHLLRKMCDGSCDKLLKRPKLVMLFGGNTLHEQEGASSAEKRRYLRRLTKSIGPGAAQRLVEAKFGPYGKAYNEQMQRLFSKDADILGFEEAGVSGRKASRLLKRFLKKVRDFSAQFKANYTHPSTDTNSADSAELAGNLITESFTSTFGVVSGAVCSGQSPRSSGRDPDVEYQIKNANICKITDPKVRYDDRIELAKNLVDSSDNQFYFPWIENLFREHPPSFRQDGTPYYENHFENIAFNEFKSKHPTLPDGLKELMDKTDNGFTKVQQLSTARYLNWISPKDYNEKVKDILKKEFRKLKRSGLDQDTIDLLCHLQPVVEKVIVSENILKPYKRRWKTSIRKLESCFRSR